MRLFSLQNRLATVKQVCFGLALALTATLANAQADTSRTGLTVTVPNGYANIAVDDMRVRSTAGAVRWMRIWDGKEWKFNPHWESLSQSWKNLTGSQTADTTGSTATTSSTAQLSGGAGSGGGGDSGCWVWVDEDWQPSTGTALIGGIPQAGPMLPARTTPFNRVMGEETADYPPPMRVSVDYASLCVGAALSSGIRDAEGIRRQNELYLGESGRYAFSNRAVLEKRAVRALPTADAATITAQLASGSIAPAPVVNDKGYRWMDKSGDWIDYNTQGQVVAYGDKNDNAVWLARDTDGMVRGVIDANGRVVYTLHYTGALIAEIRDYPIAGNSGDLPARSVKYQYDVNNRLTQVTDVRGNTTKYDYDAANRIVKITDQEGRIEQLAYNGDTVAKRTAPDGGVTDYAFDYDDTNKQFASKITGPETEAGRRVEDLTHNRVAKPVRRVVNGRIDEEVHYDTGARAEIRTNARGFSTRTTRNEFDQVVQVDQEDGTVVKRSYSALNLQLTEETDEAGIKTQYQYDGKGNLTKKTEAAGTPDERVTEYEVNSLGQTIRATRKGRTEANGTVTPDAAWQIEYDAQGQVRKTTDPEGNARQYAYDRASNLVSATDALGNTTRYDVDADGNLIKVTDALGHTRSYVYDKVGNLVTVTDARGKKTQSAYDAMNRRTQTVNPVGGIYKMHHNGQGLPVSEADEDNRTSQAEFDNFLRITKEIDALGNVTVYSYAIPDGSGSGTLGTLYAPTEVNYPTFTKRNRLDERERPTSETLLNPNSLGTEGLVSSTAYDKRGRVKSETDANGKTRFYSYDALGQLLETTDSLGNKTQAQYDARGNLIQLTDAKGNVNRFEYDRNNRVVKEVLPLGQTTQYGYDAAGNPANRIDPNGNKTAYAFDAANRLTEAKQYKGATQLVRTTTYSWDAAGNLTAWSDTDHTRPSGQQTASATISYDDANRKTGETISYPTPQGGSYSLSYGYAYSPAGKKTALTWADGTSIAYGYSAHGELESVTIPGEGTISVNQFKWTAPAKVTLPGGGTQEKTYDGLLNLEEIKVKNPGQQVLLEVENTYGKVQELKQSIRSDTAYGSTKSSSHAYDDETRLTQVTTDTGGLFGTDTESFTLDAVGNRIAHSRISGAWTYDANNRLTQRGTGSNATMYQYDEAGNLTGKTEPGNKVTQYAYDTQNRLAEIKDGSGNLIAKYGYDPLDRRIWKEQYRDKDGNALAQATRTYYLYADEGLITEATQAITLNADESVTSSSAPEIVAQYGVRPGTAFTTGILFVKARNSNDQDVVAYYHHDHLGTPMQATDKIGNVVWSASYNGFGRAAITTPDATGDNPTINSNLRLPGQIEDEETGLHYNWHRYYDPNVGRYIQSDPIGLAGGTNTYAYVYGNPLRYVDPTGEIAVADDLVIGGTVLIVGCAITSACRQAVADAINGLGNLIFAKPYINDPQAQAEHDEYKRQYKEPPPPFKDPCDELRWRLKREEDLLRARQAWDAKWLPGRHAGMNGEIQSQNAIRKLKEKMKQQGCDCS